MSENGSLQLVIFPMDQNDPYMRNQHIEIHRYDDWIEIRQGNAIMGSVRLEKETPSDPTARFTFEPMVVIQVRNGAKPKGLFDVPKAT